MINLDNFEKEVFSFFGLDADSISDWIIEKLDSENLNSFTIFRLKKIFLRDMDDRLSLYHELIHAIKGSEFHRLYDVDRLERMVTNAAQIIYYYTHNPRNFYSLKSEFESFDLLDLLLNSVKYFDESDIALMQNLVETTETLFTDGEHIDVQELADTTILLIFALLDEPGIMYPVRAVLKNLIERQKYGEN